MRQLRLSRPRARPWESTFLLGKMEGKCGKMLEKQGFFRGQQPSQQKSWALTWAIMLIVNRSTYTPLLSTNFHSRTPRLAVTTSRIIFWYWPNINLHCPVMSNPWDGGDNHKQSGLKYIQWKKSSTVDRYITPYLTFRFDFPVGGNLKHEIFNIHKWVEATYNNGGSSWIATSAFFC